MTDGSSSVLAVVQTLARALARALELARALAQARAWAGGIVQVHARVRARALAKASVALCWCSAPPAPPRSCPPPPSSSSAPAIPLLLARGAAASTRLAPDQVARRSAPGGDAKKGSWCKPISTKLRRRNLLVGAPRCTGWMGWVSGMCGKNWTLVAHRVVHPCVAAR